MHFFFTLEEKIKKEKSHTKSPNYMQNHFSAICVYHSKYDMTLRYYVRTDNSHGKTKKLAEEGWITEVNVIYSLIYVCTLLQYLWWCEINILC